MQYSNELCGCYFFDKQPCFLLDEDLKRQHHDFSPLPSTPLAPMHKTKLLSFSFSDHDVFAMDESILDCIIELQDLTHMAGPTSSIRYPDLYVRTYLSARTVVEYKLLRLCAGKESTDYSRTVCLAAQIYVNRVLRTFSRGALFLDRLAERLKIGIEVTLSIAPPHTKMPACMLWVAVLGALAARDGPLRVWFVEFVYSGCHDMGLGVWRDLQGLLGSFLWPDSYLDSDAFSMWKEVEQLGAGSQIPLLPYRWFSSDLVHHPSQAIGSFRSIEYVPQCDSSI
jgi:hypothetical protein